MKDSHDSTDRTRLDKWLWAARFFKHRTLATDAVEGGKVQLNGIRVKPAKDVKIGDRVEIQLAEARFTLIVTGIAEKRGSATVAQTLYAETPESIAARETAREERKFAATPGADLHGRPTKRDRRLIGRFNSGG
ncbi:RNA-binding S4 domain-containing protein [Zoogloea sp. 1C4]|jgi:ribosome-associated heat shock protein Hsp15|uniref:RNA-binding S4 domain-containing protein n=1 Tax=Zoogloea sp. 1C4 TaxID=2570190 RepID=UPI001292BB42|nr:RNA-binding S4 domain-containing protein [Zoogloea sp. 1C4]